MTPKSLMLAASLTALAAGPALADHAWSNYHWSIPSSGATLTMPIGDNVSSAWDFYLTQAIRDWNLTGIIEAPAATGGTNPKSCKPVPGRIEVCSSSYGRTGWLGIAQIWLSGDHISQGITKLNDTYFNTAQYNTPSWRAMVTCQEIGHDYGLGHVNENFDDPNTGSCMDYTNDPSGTKGTNGTKNNEHPNAHDEDMLNLIYGHGHSTGTAGAQVYGQNVASEAAGGDTPAEWGRPIDFLRDGRPHVFERTIAPGRRMITHVFWALGEGPRRPQH